MTIDLSAHPDLLQHGRELDRALRPVVERILARLGLTWEQVEADPSVVLRAAASTHGDTDPPGRSGTARSERIAGQGESLPNPPFPIPPVPVALAGDPHAAEAAPRLPSAGTPRPIRAARGAAHTTTEAT